MEDNCAKGEHLRYTYFRQQTSSAEPSACTLFLFQAFALLDK